MRATTMSENRERARAARATFLRMLDADVCYRALRARDERFDGRVFVGVTSTHIYCRPICTAGTAKRENCLFFPSAAAAQEAGFRPCLRCRPESAPEHASWRGTSNTVSRGLALIAEGELDGENASVDRLAERLGVGERQLRRLFTVHLGASPISVAQTRRVLFAKQLLHDTCLPMAEVALAAGFGSVRRFNETFRALYDRPPSALRRKTAVTLREGSVAASGVTVRLRYRAPYDWESMLSYLRARAIDGVEAVSATTYFRTVMCDGATGTIEVGHQPERQSLVATIRFPNVRILPELITRIRRVFDLGADAAAIGAHLARDPLLRPLVAARPGLRAPGAWDGFELAVRAILGQQVSVEAGRKLASGLVKLAGAPLRGDGPSPEKSLTHAFPDALTVSRSNLSSLGMPNARRAALSAIAKASLADPALFQARGTLEETVAHLMSIRGIGDWTAQYIALRAAREPDAFPSRDVALLRGVTSKNGKRPSATELTLRAESWRPWRAYAAQHLWTANASLTTGATK